MALVALRILHNDRQRAEQVSIGIVLPLTPHRSDNLVIT